MTAVNPFPVVKDIPEDQPFVVHRNPARRLLVAGPVWAVLQLALLVLVIVAFAGGDDTGDSGAGQAVLDFVVISVVLALFFSGALLPVLAGRAPVLAIGPAGLWVRTRPVFGKAVWLPWEAILLISRRRFGFDRMLIVRPRDERVAALSRYGTGFNRAFQRSGFMTSLNMSDRTEAEILQAVAYFAANRVPLTCPRPTGPAGPGCAVLHTAHPRLRSTRSGR